MSIGTTAVTSTPVAKLDVSIPVLLPSGSKLSPIGKTNIKGAQIGYTPRSAGMTIVCMGC